MRADDQYRDHRNEPQGARGGYRSGRYNEQQHQYQQPPVGRAPIRARDVPERLGPGPRPTRQQVDDDSQSSSGATKEKKGAAVAEFSNRFGLLDEDEDAGPTGEDEPLSSSLGGDRPSSRHSGYDYD